MPDLSQLAELRELHLDVVMPTQVQSVSLHSHLCRLEARVKLPCLHAPVRARCALVGSRAFAPLLVRHCTKPWMSFYPAS